MAVFITGDTHGSQPFGPGSCDGYMSRFNTKNFPEQKELTLDDIVIICGDFGGVWDVDRTACRESKSEKHDLDWLAKKNFTIAFVPGNHENYDRLTGVTDSKILESWFFNKMPDNEKAKMEAGYPRIRWNGGYARAIRENVIMMEPGVFQIQGKTIFAYGGAASHDIDAGVLNPADFPDEKAFKAEYARWSSRPGSFRVRHVSWWNQEEPGPEIQDTARKTFEKAGWKADIIVTHTCPSEIHAMMGFHRHGIVEQFLQEVKENTSYENWFFGHLHEERDFPGNREHVTYGSIIQIA